MHYCPHTVCALHWEMHKEEPNGNEIEEGSVSLCVILCSFGLLSPDYYQ